MVSRGLTTGHASAHPEQVAALQAMLGATSSAGYAANCLAVRESDLRPLVSRIGGARHVEQDAAHLSNQEVPAQFAGAVLAFLL